MDLERETKLAIYQHFATTGVRPTLGDLATRVGAGVPVLREVLAQLRARRVLVVDSDGESIRMAPPFSGIPTQHRVVSNGISYFANCAWDALGIPAALHKPAMVYSRCEQSMEPLELSVSESGPPPSDWVFHCVVPAAHWWDDIVFT